jgi:membrane protein DedA with SNARE-associated domain
MSLASLIENYGYLALLVGSFLEGETPLVLAGFAAQRGHLELRWVIAVAFTGSFAGDQLFFYLGRRYGPALINRRASWRNRADKVYRMIERNQIFLILSFRFYYGLRSVTPFAIGASNVSRLRFLVLNAIGALIWAIALGWAGYLFGHAFELWLDDFKRYELYVLGGLALAGVIIWLTNLYLGAHKPKLKDSSPGSGDA